MKSANVSWLGLCPLLLSSAACSSATECTSYAETGIAALRTARGSGCFELKDVVVVARTPSSKSPRLYLQDRAGGDFSAVMAKCDPASSSHPCPQQTQADLTKLLDGASLTARGYYHQGSQSGFEELYLDSVIDSGSLALPPAPLLLEPADVAKEARRPAAWFQRVAITVPPADPWVIADLSPAELALGSTCPRFAGFAMLPASKGVPVAADCVNGENPPSASPAPAGEILIGRQFYDGFWASSDCACALDHKQHLISSFSTLVGTVKGLLLLEQIRGFTVQVFEPATKADFPVSGG